VGCTDFSTSVYSYNETPGDYEMKKFALTPDELNFKVGSPAIIETYFLLASWYLELEDDISLDPHFEVKTFDRINLKTITRLDH